MLAKLVEVVWLYGARRGLKKEFNEKISEK